MADKHRWDVTPAEAVEIQRSLRNEVSLRDEIAGPKTVAGVDVSIGRGRREGRCAVVVLSYPDLSVIESRVHCAPVVFPYVPGLLAFREMPIFLRTLELIDSRPDLYFFDGHGCAHPRRFGLACYAGILLDAPVIGCAKSRLIGDYVDPAPEAGSISDLIDGGERIGQVLRTRTGTKPVFVSPGHRVSFETATHLALACTRGHRIPEPTRLAHRLSVGLDCR